MRGATQDHARGVSEHSHIRKWNWDDPWNGAALTEGAIRAQSLYAKEMHDAAMRGRLEFFDPPKPLIGA
jgi:hypothetical protein